MSDSLELNGRRALVAGTEYVIDGGTVPTV
jgi:hypothetical protein